MLHSGDQVATELNVGRCPCDPSHTKQCDAMPLSPASVYISTIEPDAGKSLISLGLVDLLLRRSAHIGYFRPIIAGKHDAHLNLILGHFNLAQDAKQSYAFTAAEANELLGQGRLDELLDGIIRKYKALSLGKEFVLVEGTDFAGESASFEFDINAAIARNLGCPVVLVGSGLDRTPEEAARQLRVALDNFTAEETEVIGAMLNRVPEDALPTYEAELRSKLGGTGKRKAMAVLPQSELLASPTVREVVASLGGELVHAAADALERPVRRFSVAAMQLPGLLDFVSEDCAVVTPADRGDIIVGVLAAHRSADFPSISCLIVTGPIELPTNISRLIEGLAPGVTILRVKSNSFETALALSRVRSRLSTDNPTKIRSALRLFHEHIDTTHLADKIADFKPRGISPQMFLYALRERARKPVRHIVLPEGNDERILRAAGQLLRDGLVRLTLLGDRSEIERLVTEQNIDLDLQLLEGIIAPEHSPHRRRYAEELYRLRKHKKGMTELVAADLMTDVSYYGTMMVQLGEADGMVSGAAHTTQHTIRPALQFVKTKPGVALVSSVFFMCLPDRVVVYGDCAINPDPSAEELAQIAVTSADTSAAFGIEPRVALLSYSSGASGKGSDVEKVREAARLAKALRPNVPIDGPLQYDAAVDAGVAAKKMPESAVAGNASVLVFPDLNTGNNTYKAVQRETGAIAVGPVLQGLNKPVNDLSRGCTVDDVVNTVLITAIQAGE